MRWRRELSGFILSVLLVLVPVAIMSAQASTRSSVTEDVPTGILAEYDLSQVPSRHAEVWFLRISLAPGGTFPIWWKSGVMLYYVESGELSIQSSGPVVSNQPGSNAQQSAALLPGESILAPVDVLVEASNPEQTRATFLLLLMIFTTGGTEKVRTTGDASGFELTRLAYGTAEFQPGPVTITLDRVSVSAGETLESPRADWTDVGYGWMGLDAGTVETGIGRVSILHRSEEGTIMRPDASPVSSQYPPIKFETELTFPTGWGYFLYNAELTWTNIGEGPLTILRVVVTPNERE